MSKSEDTGQVTLTQMLGALDKDVATKVGSKLKKLSKKKQLKAPNELEAAKAERQSAYQEATKQISKWEPIVKRMSKSKLSFPLDQQTNALESSAAINFKPRNEFEKEIQKEIDYAEKEKDLTPAEKQYLKAIGADEAKERIKEMQKTRVLLTSFGAKMKRQNKIKSKSYRRLLKQERIKKHMKGVESNEDKLLNEIERLKKIRAQERATLRHKNTGKWAKHAKFRAKYDDEARQALLEQIGVARKRLDKPVADFGDDHDTEDDESSAPEESASDDDNESSSGGEDSAQEIPEKSVSSNRTKQNHQKSATAADANDRLIVSSELINSYTIKKRKPSLSNDDASEGEVSDEGASDDDDDDEQRKLMSEAFANDDVVGDFKKMKEQLADEEQPKDINLFLPGWGDWAGPGIKTNRRKRRKFIIKAKKVARKDESLNNVIISEKANDEIRDLQLQNVPRGFKDEKHLSKVLTRPVVAQFTDHLSQRELTKPQVTTKMGARIEPISEKVLRGGSKVKWA